MNTSKNTPIELELKKLDFTEKEIRIYLICLEMKNLSVQKIAKLAELSRPTTYRIIESLIKKGLVSRYGQQKSSPIRVESPDEILGLLRVRKRKLEEQEREFLRIISVLKNKYYSDGKNEIKIFSDQEGVNFLLDDLSTTHAKKISVLFLGENRALEKDLAEVYKSIRRRLGKIDIREIHSEKTNLPKNSLSTKKFICASMDDSQGVLVLSDKFMYLEKNCGIIVENEETVEIIQILFEIIWKLAK